MMIFLLERVENIVKKGENASKQYFLLFPQCFQKVSSSGWLMVGIVWERTCLKHFISSAKLAIRYYFMLSGRILRNIGENIFRSYTGTISENTHFHVLVA